MQWTEQRRQRITAIVAIVAALTASAVLTAGYGSAAQSAPNRTVHTCPPAC